MDKFFRWFSLLLLLAMLALAWIWFRPDIEHYVTSIAPDYAVPSQPSYLAADYSIKRGEPERARRYFQRYLTEEHVDTDTLLLGIRIMLMAGDFEGAVQLAEQYTKKYPDDVFANLVLVVNYLKENQDKKAHTLSSFVMDKKNGKSLPHLDHMVFALVHHWNLVEQERGQEATVALYHYLKEYRHFQAMLYYHIALSEEFLGNKKEAFEVVDDAAELNELPYHYVRLVASFYAKHNKTDNALALLKKYQNVYPEYHYFYDEIELLKQGKPLKPIITNAKEGVIQVLMESMRMLYHNQIYPKALAYGALVLALDPHYDEALFLTGSYYQDLELYDKAIDLFEKISPDSDFYLYAQAQVAKSYYKIGETYTAKKMFMKLSQSHEGYYYPMMTYADLLKFDGSCQKALLIYNKIIHDLGELEPIHGSIVFSRATCYEQMKNWEAAEKDLKTALNLLPNNPVILNYLGYSWVDRNQHLDKAMNMLEKAIQARPGDAHIIDSVAWALLKLDRVEDALFYAEHAVTLKPYDPVINDHLGDIYWRLGRKREAKYQWERAMKYSDEMVDLEEIRKKLYEAQK